MTTFSVESKSQLAKLLATENLSIQHQKISTARFDPKNRVLYCPIWQDMSGDMYDLLMGHEVGHALETPAEGWHDAVTVGNKGKNYKHFLNVVEDARIEKKIKRRYPGLRASFVRGYKNLLDRDFFGIINKDVNQLPFVDRLNLYTKGGTQLGIEFNQEETTLLNRVENCETWQDVLDVTGAVFDYSKDEQFNIQQESFASYKFDYNDSEFDDEFENDDYDYDSQESNTEEDENSDNEEGNGDDGDAQSVDEEHDDATQQKSKKSDGEADESKENIDSDKSSQLNRYKDSSESKRDQFEPTCSTDESFRENETALLDAQCKEYVYVDMPKPILKNILTPYKRVHQLLEDHYKMYDRVDANKLYNEFKQKNDRYVGLLAKEFEMKKAARAYSKTKTANTGDIDISRLYKYQVDDNIFRKMQRTPKGKSHGLVLLLDRSGSMSDNMAGSLEQIMVLALFCRKVNIPFVVYGFGDCDESRRLDFPNVKQEKTFEEKIGSLAISNVYLREYINSRMGNAEFTRCMKNLSVLKHSYENRYAHYLRPQSEHLSNTPLIQAMIALRPLVNDFRKMNNLDLVNLVVVNDGDADNCNSKIDIYRYPNGTETLARRGFDNRTQNVILRDDVSKLTITLRSEAPNGHYDDAVRAGIFDWFRAVTGAKIFGFFIAGQNRSLRQSLCAKYVYSDGTTVYDKLGIPRNARRWNFNPQGHDITKDLAKTLVKNKFVQSYNNGYNSFFIIPGGAELAVQNDELQVEGKVTASKLKTAFLKMSKAKQVNRVLVSKFIEGIAA
jgi:uncharacterized protein with von Willebrand factor type A (vWA) domain